MDRARLPAGDRPAPPECWRWIRLGKLRWQIHADFIGAALLARLAAPATLMSPPARVIRPRTGSGTTEVARVVAPELPDAPLILKRYHRGSLWQRFRDCFRTPRARRAFAMAFRLRQNGVPTALPVAAAGNRWPWKDAGFLITAEVRSACRLYEFSRECREARERKAVIQAFARLMAALHDLGLVAGDPSLTNFLLVRDPENRWRPVLIDLDGVRTNRLGARGGEWKSLRRLSARAALDARERLLFLVAYCRARRPPLDARQTAARIGVLPPFARHGVTPQSVHPDPSSPKGTSA
jgi:hypothetical protein